MGSNSFGASALIEAIRANSLHRVVSALDDGADIEETDIHGFAGLPLRTACFTGEISIIRELINRGADVNALTADGTGAPLRLAMRAGHTDIVALLLANQAQVPEDLDIPPSVFERAREISAGQINSLDVPMLEFESHPLPETPAPGPADLSTSGMIGDNIIEFDNTASDEHIEHVDMKGVYGVDTNILAIDFERSGGAWEKVSPASDPAKPISPETPGSKE
ncbi:hypothetical protein BJN45_04660 [Azonexus hydrophilus]|uniref:Uncharacterized protein n=1 Tax=Azonexus hydrophilus TaxID=418702 RepID=A0A1R1I6Y9_9RHOO|nr:ankyrin repeat domain-containing protein [Azonexus hydrophilus]OMG54526.1 hypothetical protein BJN45_04660 [Azonexus hydrophilus]